jgi:DNA-directed RNA polymerase specialized sigma24 family protein
LGYALRWGLRDPQTVADAAMNETLRVYRKRKGKFGPLLFIILRWRAISAYRDQCRNAIVTVAIVEDMDLPVEGASPMTDDEELKSALREAWAGLEPVERHLLRLHIVKGLTFPEIRKLKYFRAQGWAVATLRSKAHRALLKLRDQLQAFCGAAAQACPSALS